MDTILFYLIGFIVGGIGIYIAYVLSPIYNNVRTRLVKRLGVSTVNFLEEQAMDIVTKIEDDFGERYFDDPDGESRHNLAKALLEDVVSKTKLDDKINEADIDDFIEGTVKAAGLAKGKNPYKK